MYGGGAAIPGFSVMESASNAETGWSLNGFLGLVGTGQVSVNQKGKVSGSLGLSSGKAVGVTVDYVGDPFFKW